MSVKKYSVNKYNIKEYKDSLLNFDLKPFLESWSGKDIFKLKDKYPGLYPLLAEQLKLYPKAAEKLPMLTESFCFLTPKGYEQSSSEAAAEYKASLAEGNVLLDLTGGLGVDDIAFSKRFGKVISVDINGDLNELVRINLEKLKIRNVERITADANEYIKKNIRADLVYVDADRRVKGKKSVTLEASEPNVPAMLTRLFEISGKVLLKLSPLIDITYLSGAFSTLKKLAVVSVEGEVKEILTLLEKNYSGGADTDAVDISKGKIKKYSSRMGESFHPKTSTDGKFFYEASPALIKSGLVNKYAAANGLNPVSKNSAYLISDAKVQDFFGRSFSIVNRVDFSKSALKRFIKDNNITRANISKRNFPMGAEELKKLAGIKDGGDDYLFFTKDDTGQKLLYHCRKLKN